MKKIIITLILCFVYAGINAQDRHRAGDSPYDLFLSVRGCYHLVQDNFKDNYSWGAGGKIVAEWQYQEIKLSWGISMGYSRYQPKWLKWDFVPTKQLFVAQEIPVTLFVNYYFFNNKVKPYVGVGGSVMWGKYDYSFSNMENTYTTGRYTNLDEYYYKDFEVEGGFKFGVIPHVGFMFSLDHRNAFGAEFSWDKYFSNGRLEKQNNYTATLYYTYIID
ncbi:MAG: hypothetical protein IJ250_03940 [Bacteroidales bacterium]|nr:hypothetical protein [Bacteroidales bacterium]